MGSDVIEKNGQAYGVRGIGIIQSIQDFENIIVDHTDGNPILVKNLADVRKSSMPRVGQVGLNGNDS